MSISTTHPLSGFVAERESETSQYYAVRTFPANITQYDLEALNKVLVDDYDVKAELIVTNRGPAIHDPRISPDPIQIREYSGFRIPASGVAVFEKLGGEVQGPLISLNRTLTTKEATREAVLA